jgi:hypothetical protein
MKKVWKWILGILAVLVVVTVLVTVPFAMRRGMAANYGPGNLPQQSQSGEWNGPMMRGFDRDGQNNGGQRQGPGGFGNKDFSRQGMMGGRGFAHMGGGFFAFSPLMVVFGGLLRLAGLALFGLLLYGIYVFGKRAGVRSALAPAPVATQPAPPAAESEEKLAE